MIGKKKVYRIFHVFRQFGRFYGWSSIWLGRGDCGIQVVGGCRSDLVRNLPLPARNDGGHRA